MNRLDGIAPLLFVGIWATGFVLARFVGPYAEPLAFLTLRFALSAVVFALLALAAGAPWPRSARAWGAALLCGVLMQGAYLFGVFWSVRHGLPAGIAALVGGLQPLLTAALAIPLLDEAVGPRRWLGIGLGFVGAAFVLAPGLAVPGTVHPSLDSGGLPLLPLAVCLGGTLAMTLGTILQKRTGSGGDLRAGAAVQFLGATLAMAPVAAATGEFHFGWAWQAWAGLAWGVLGLSVGAIGLLLRMIRRGAVSGVASLFYLVPPAAALIAYLGFGERLGLLQIAGMGLAGLGVALASRAGPAPTPRAPHASDRSGRTATTSLPGR